MSSKKNKNKKPAASNSGFSFKSPFVIVLIVVVLLALAGGITAGVVMRGDDSGGTKGSAGIKLPAYASANTAPKGSEKAYTFALDYPEYLAAVPCYCGCGQSENHRSNLDCFIESRNGDKVLFDDHASY
jgi:hypothetical protein